MVAVGERAAVASGCCGLRQSQASRRGELHRSGSDKRLNIDAVIDWELRREERYINNNTLRPGG